MLTEVFLSFAITSFIGCLLAFTKMLYKSKCKSCKFYGFELIRDVESEEKLDEIEMLKSKKENTTNTPT